MARLSVGILPLRADPAFAEKRWSRFRAKTGPALSTALRLALVLVVLAACLFWAPQPVWAGEAQAALASGTKDSDSASRFADREVRYRIQPSDVLEFRFRFTPEFDQTVKVQPDGYVALKEAGEFKVGGMTVSEATEATTKAYGNILREPVVTIVLKEFNMPRFVVGGEVQKPGRYDLEGNVMLSEAIQMAGGFSPSAKTTEVLVFRRLSREWVETRKIDFKQALQNGLREDILLRPGDLIYVSRSRLGKVRRFMESSKLGVFFSPVALL